MQFAIQVHVRGCKLYIIWKGESIIPMCPYEWDDIIWTDNMDQWFFNFGTVTHTPVPRQLFEFWERKKNGMFDFQQFHIWKYGMKLR